VHMHGTRCRGLRLRSRRGVTNKSRPCMPGWTNVAHDLPLYQLHRIDAGDDENAMSIVPSMGLYLARSLLAFRVNLSGSRSSKATIADCQRMGQPCFTGTCHGFYISLKILRRSKPPSDPGSGGGCTWMA
jgi:hypothetical protein